MAIETTTVPVSTTPLPQPVPMKLSWGAIFGGAVAALAIWLMLYALGLALGLSAIDPNQPDSARSSGIFTGIWGLVAPLVALFVGGMVASRGAGPATRLGGATHGLVMWGVTTLVGAWLVMNMLSAVVGGVASVGKTAAQAGAGAISAAAGQAGQAGDAASALGLDANSALQPVNDRLRAEGKPEVTAAQLQAAAKDVVQEGVQSGQFNRALLVSNIAQNTALSQQDAQEIASRVETQFNEMKGKAGEKLQTAANAVGTGALKAADASGKAFWGIFGALFLGMISAVLGATTGVSRRQKDVAEGKNIRRHVELPANREREVYP